VSDDIRLSKPRRFRCASDADPLQQYVKVTQEELTEAYALAVRACKQRFPQIGGFLA
jgi:hypothetical protein